MAYSNFFHIKKNGDGVELRFLKTVIDDVDCVINNKTVARKDGTDTYLDDRHDEVPTIDKHFNIEYGDVLYVSETKAYISSDAEFTSNSSLIIVVYKQGRPAELVYCFKKHLSDLKDVVLDTFCLFKDGKMVPLDASMFMADKPNIKTIEWEMGYLHNRVYKEDVDRYSCEFNLEQADGIYRKMFAGISNTCI